MREQVIEIEKHRVRMCFTTSWEHDSKLMILWDVHVRHRHADFVFPHMIVLFILANITEIFQPFDRYFNALIKSLLCALHNT